jgi:hypothetical protein
MTMFGRLTLAIALIACGTTAMADGVTPFGEALYWHASAETSSVWSNTAYEHTSFSANNVPFDWNAGFRAGFGHKFDDESWDVKLSWTYFRTSQNGEVSVGNASNGAVVPEFFSGLIGGTYDNFPIFSQSAIDWKLNYNTIDLEFGRSVALGDSAWVRPAMGIKTAVIQQDVHLDLSHPAWLISAVEDVSHDFWGIGPSFGVSGGWKLPKYKNLSLIGSFSVDFLFGQWNVNDTYARTDGYYPLLFGTYGAMTTDMTNSCLGVPVLRYFAGLEWVHPGNVTITARVGYELQWWANQQRMLAFQQLPMHGDLTIEGLTCGVSIGF